MREHSDVEGGPAELEDAVELVDLLLAALIAAANPPTMNYRGDARAYQNNWRDLRRILDPLGIRLPFPWPSLDEGVAAAKAVASDRSSHARRREFFNQRADRVKATLQARINDHAAGDVTAAVTDLDALADNALTNARAVRTELARIEASLPRDPGMAIGKAKNLIEATAKAVLNELGQSYSDKDSVNSLVVTSMRALRVDRQAVETDYDRDLANLMQKLNSLTIGVADLRNRAGDGHGMSDLPPGLDLRHGRLAVRAAVAWAAFMLDTLHDQTS